MGSGLPVPDYTTLCRRAATAPIRLPRRAAGPLHLVLDSTGLKVYGEGEWKVRQHGYSRRRTWLKLHLAIDPDSHEIQAAMVSERLGSGSAEFSRLADAVPAGICFSHTSTGNSASGGARTLIGCRAPSMVIAGQVLASARIARATAPCGPSTT